MVFFVAFSGSWCTTVPDSWINENKNTITWPHKKINVTLACKKKFVPKADWETFKYNKLLGPYDNYDTARAVEIAAVDMSTCDETSVKSIVDREKNTKRKRKKPLRFHESSSSGHDSDKNKDSNNGKDKDLELDDSDKVVLPSFNYKLLGPYDNSDTAQVIEIAAADMSTCDETSVKSIVDREKNITRKRKKLLHFHENSSSGHDSDKNKDSNNGKDKDLELDDSDKVVLPSINYDGGNDDGTKEQCDIDFTATQELEYGNFFDNPPHPKFKQSGVMNKPVISNVEIVEIPGIGGQSTKSVDKDYQKLKSLLQLNNLDESKLLKNPENKPSTSCAVGSSDIVTNPKVHDDHNGGAGFSNTKKSNTIPRAPSQPHTMDTMDRVDSLTEQSLQSHNCCLACRSALISVSSKLDLFLNIYADNPRPTTTRQSNVLPDFPISSYEDLMKFNKLLDDKEVARTQYENLIKQRRNTDGKKCIRGVLGFILTSELCCKLSWSGQKKTIKVEKMSFVEHLKDTVIANSRSSLDDCKQAIMSWLQHANDRIKTSAGKHNPQ